MMRLSRSYRIGAAALVCSFAVAALCPGPSAAQGPGLYKDGRKVLDLQEMAVELPGIDKAADAPSSPGRELYRRVMGEDGHDAGPLSRYLDLAAACQQALRYRDARPDETDTAAGTLSDLEPALVRAHEDVLEHLAQVRSQLQSSPELSDKIDRLEALERDHLPRAERLLAALAALRDAVEGGHVFAQDGALQDLERIFADDPVQVAETRGEDARRPVPMEVVKPAVRPERPRLKAASPVYPPTRGAAAATDPADLAPTIDVQLTPEIVALADSLDRSPVKMYHFVRDQLEFEPYLGSRKGSQQTLEHRKGNDTDQASLLIALLRASGIPARYASGEAYMPMDRALSWLGFSSATDAASLLATAGMDAVLYPDAIACQRVWVEAYIPFANYRGAVNDSTGQMWIPLDPVFRQHTIEPGYNLPADMGFDAESFVEDYMTTFRASTPAEHFEQLLSDELGNYYPGATLDDLRDRRTVVPEPGGILAGTLPYELLAFDGTYSEVPASQRYGIRFHVYGGGTDLDYTTTTPEIVLKQVTLSYEGATPGDQALIDAAGGVFRVTDPYLIDVVPILKIDGCEVARGTGQVMMGTTHYSDMHFTPPVGASNVVPTVSNVITAGNYQGLGIDTQDAFPATFETSSTTCSEDPLGYDLHQTALTYLNSVDTAEDRVAEYLHCAVLNDVSEAIVENAVTVYFSGSLPVSFTWSGMIVDADRKIVGPFARDGRNASCQQMRVAGADGSFQENRVFEVRFEEEAISAVKILSLAADSLITVCKITSSIAADCPDLPLYQDSATVNAVNAALSQGHHVYVPERPFDYFDWSGTAWIDMDPATCAAGYIISGGHSGGATVQTWWIWWPGLRCLNPTQEVTVSPTGAGADNDLYSASDGSHWTFTAPDVQYIGRTLFGSDPCEVLTTRTRTFYVRYSIKTIAQYFGVGEYEFQIGETGPCGACNEKTKKVTIFKVELEKCDAAWRPKGGSEDNTTTIRSFVTPSSVTGEFEFTLTDVSDEKGYCLNAPIPTPTSGEDSAAWKDLQFQDPQTGFAVSGSDKDVATTSGGDVAEATVTVKSFDYGAFGRIKADFTTSDGSLTVAAREVGGSNEYTPLPVDTDGNHVPDGATQNSGPGSGTAATDDTDNTPTGIAGDGFTRYEEWRGFMVGGNHVRTNTAKRDLFVYDGSNIGVGYFASASGITTHVIDAGEWSGAGKKASDKRIINVNRDTAASSKQYGLELIDGGSPAGSWGYAWGDPNDSVALGPPGVCWKITIETSGITSAPTFTQAWVDRTIAHETGHGCSVEHHSPNDHGGDACVMREDQKTSTGQPSPVATDFCTSTDNCQNQLDVDDP